MIAYLISFNSLLLTADIFLNDYIQGLNMNKEEQLKELEEYTQIFANYLKSQGINEGELEICLDSIRLSTLFDFLPATLDELKKSQAFVAYSCGIGRRKDGKQELIESRKIQYDPKIYTPGKTNQGLAKVILDYYGQGIKLPVFSQWEIGVALEDMGFSGELHIARPKEGRYLSTEGVVKQFLEDGLDKMENIAIVAYKNHMRRARATTRYETERRRSSDFEKVLMTDTKNILPDPESVQDWTRGGPIEIRNEIGSRIHHYISLFGSGIPIKYFLD